MPSLDTIRTITIKATTDGVDDATKSLKGLASAQDNVAVVSDTSSKSTLNAQSALDRLRRQVDTNFASQQQFAKGETTLQKAMNQGLISTSEYAKIHDLLVAKYTASGAASKLLEKDTGKISEVMAVVESRAVGMSASMGMVGAVLQVIGPIGLAVGAALGVGVVALNAMTEAADRLGDKARALREFGENVGLTATQVQALTIAGAGVGLSSEQVSTGITRLTSSMDELRNGTGTALAQIRRISPDLADQLATVKDTGAAVDLLAKAWENADTFQRNALSKSLFGKGGASSGAMLGQIADAGGLQAYIDAQKKSIVLTDDQTKHLADLKTEIDASGMRIRDTIASWFSSSILENQKQARSEMEGILAAVKAWSQTTAPSWWNSMKDYLRSSATHGDMSPQSRINGAFEETGAHPLSQPISGGIPLPSARPASNDNAGPTAAYILSQRQAESSVLGAAATGSEQLALKTAQLNAENERAGGIYSSLVERAKAYYLVQQSGADLLIKVQNGAATATQLYAQKQNELQELVKKGTLTQDQATASLEVYANKGLKDTIAQMQVMKSNLPQLTQLGIDAGNLNKQLDTFAVTSLNAVSPAIQDMLNGTVSLQDGFKNLGLTVVKAAENMIIQLLILRPLVQALGSYLGIGSGPVTLGNASGPTAFPAAHGRVFENSNIVPFARGGVVNRPTLFPFASGTGLMGEAGPEAIVPLKRGRDGNLGITSSGGGNGSGTQVNVNVMNFGNDNVSVNQKQNGNGGVDLEVMVGNAAAGQMAKKGSALRRVTDTRAALASR